MQRKVDTGKSVRFIEGFKIHEFFVDKSRKYNGSSGTVFVVVDKGGKVVDQQRRQN